MKRKGLSFILTVAMLLMQLPVLSAGAAESGEISGAAAGKIICNQDFEGSDIYKTIYDMDGGFYGTQFNAENTRFEQVANADGSHYGSIESGFNINGIPFFYNSDGTIDKNAAITTGKLKIHFRFKTNDSTINGEYKYGTVCIGNRASGSKWTEWLSLLDVDGTSKNISAATFNNSKGADEYLLKNSKGEAAKAETGKWYTYDAEVDLDSHSLNIKVSDENTEYTFNKTIKVRTAKNIADWPMANNIKALMVLSSIDLDDIEVSYLALEATDLSFSDASGAASNQADVYTKQVAVNFDYPVAGMSAGAVMLDGTDYSSAGTLSEDGKTYTFTLNESLVGEREYSIEVNPKYITPADNRITAGRSTVMTFTPTGIFNKWSEDFTENVTVYAMGNSGIGAPVTDEAVFKQITEDGNRFGRNAAANWGRRGFRFDEKGISEGKLKVHFRFRPTEATLTGSNFGSVMIGNCDAKGNFLGLVNIQAEDKVMSVVNINTAASENYPLQDASGNNATEKQNTWYTYDAVVDLDTHSISTTVVEDATNTVYTRTVSDLPARTGEWNNWPKETNFRDLAFLYPMDVDDIEISYVPFEATGLSFLNASGAAGDQADIYTGQAAVHFNYPVTGILPGAVMVDGTDYSTGGTLSDDGKTYTFTLKDNLIGGRENSVTADPAKIIPQNRHMPAGESKALKFTPSGIFKWSEDFTDHVMVYAMGNKGLEGVVTDTAVFERREENGNGYGRFYAEDWGRYGFRFHETGISEGQLKVHFRFRPYERTFAENSFGAVMIGNCDVKWQMLTALNVNSTGEITAGCAKSTAYTLKNTSGANAAVKKDTWYTYDAVLNLDTHSMDIKVVEDITNEVYTLTLTNMDVRPQSGNEWVNWPNSTNFKDIACLYPMDLDDISITTECAPALSTEGAAVQASAVAYNENNILLLAQYNKSGEMIFVEQKKIELNAGEAAVVEAEANWVDGAVKAKAFLWDNLIDLNPLEDNAELAK